MMIFLILIVGIIYLWSENSNLKAEIGRLKSNSNTQQRKINFCPKCGYNLQNINNNDNIPNKSITSQISKEVVIEQKEQKKEKSPKTEAEIKNSTILTVGAILVIVAAIVFLTTTWNTSLNIIKTLVIILMYFIFLGFSYIADHYLNIKQTSKIFLYIAFSYLPLVFISISLFEVLGHYLSFYGPGKYVYLSISSIIITCIYNYYMNKRNDLFFAIGRYIFQLLSIIMTLLVFTSNINILLIGISLHNLLFHYTYDNNIFYYKKELHLIINQVVSVAIVVAIFIFISNIKNMIDIPFVILLITLYSNFYYLLTKELKEEEVFKWVGPAILLTVSLTIAKIINQGFVFYQLWVLIGIIVSSLVDILIYQKENIESYILSSIILLSVYLYTFIEHNVIPSYLLMSFYLALTIFINKEYQSKEEYNKVLIQMIPILINIGLLDFVINMKFNSIILYFIYVAIFLLDSFFTKREKKYYAVFSIPFTAISFIIILVDNVIDSRMLVLLSMILFIIYYLFHHIKENKLYKVISYIWLIVTCFIGIKHFTMIEEYIVYAIPIASIITFLLEEFLAVPEEKVNVFLQLELIASFISLIFYNNYITTIFFIIIAILFIYLNNKIKESDYWNYIPIITYNLYLIRYITIDTNMESIVITSSIITVLLLLYLLSSKKKVYIGLSLVNIIMAILNYQMNHYISTISLIISALIYNEVDEERRDIYLGTTYILITILIKLLVNDLDLNAITVFSTGIFILPILLISRTIMNKQDDSYKALEYIGLIIINFLAISSYSDEFDGMVYILLLLFLTLLGYYKKWGPVFLTSIIFIVINVFLLTKLFWLSLPWWIYILLVGFTLIAFATRNEITEEEKKKNIIKEIAKKMDL